MNRTAYPRAATGAPKNRAVKTARLAVIGALAAGVGVAASAPAFALCKTWVHVHNKTGYRIKIDQFLTTKGNGNWKRNGGGNRTIIVNNGQAKSIRRTIHRKKKTPFWVRVDYSIDKSYNRTYEVFFEEYGLMAHSNTAPCGHHTVVLTDNVGPRNHNK